MKTGVRASDGGGSLLEAAVNRRLGKMVAQIIRKHQAGVLPQLPGPQALGSLGGPVTLQEGHDGGRGG